MTGNSVPKFEQLLINRLAKATPAENIFLFGSDSVHSVDATLQLAGGAARRPSYRPIYELTQFMIQG